MSLKKKWFMYVVECADGTLYTGITTCVDRRIKEHNHTKKAAKYTRSRRPVKLIRCYEFDTHSAAASSEYKFKKLSRSQKLKELSK